MSIIMLLALCYTKKENFQLYKISPFKYRKIGTSPLLYYNKPRYRYPYRYPFQFKSTYPNNYMTYYN